MNLIFVAKHTVMNEKSNTSCKLMIWNLLTFINLRFYDVKNDFIFRMRDYVDYDDARFVDYFQKRTHIEKQ